jgi:type IV pilus assembly protein PilB
MTQSAQVPPMQPVSAQDLVVESGPNQAAQTAPQPLPAVSKPQVLSAQPAQTDANSIAQDPNSLLGILISQNLLSQTDANQLAIEQISTGKSIETLVLDKKMVNEEDLVKAKAIFYDVPFIKIAETGISPEALSVLPESVARRYQMLPFSRDDENKTLSVAMENPLDVTAIDFAQQKTGFRVVAHFATPGEIEQKIAERYAQSLSGEVSKALEETSGKKRVDLEQGKYGPSTLSGGVVRQAPITKIVETILSFAMKARASDVHIEPEEERTRIRYRIDGVLREKLILPKNVHDAVVSRVKILSKLKIDEKRIPQDGRFTFEAEGEEVDLRVSTLPTVHGEKIVMRLLKKNLKVPTLNELGLEGLALNKLQEAIKTPNGIVLITGPTGSGKTTTLYSLLHIINSPKVNILTLEDPVEYQMDGVNQVQINPQAGLTFASGLRSFLRQDPNVIMVGEIRDSETVGLAIQASLTGHLVFSTLHTNSAAGALPRLVDMGGETFLLASSVRLIMAQRVIRRINPDFKEEYQPAPEVIADIKQVLGPYFDQWCQQNNKDPNSITLYRPKKNLPQNETAFKGRIGIFEVMAVTDEISRMILQQASAAEIEQVAVNNGMLFMKQDGYLKALNGLTTIEEVIRAAEV